MAANNFMGLNELHSAVWNSNAEAVKHLVRMEDSIDINGGDKMGWSPLHHAVFEPDCKVIKILIEAGADVNKVEMTGRTPLHLAAANGFTKCVQILLEGGSDRTLESNEGYTAGEEADLTEPFDEHPITRQLRSPVKL